MSLNVGVLITTTSNKPDLDALAILYENCTFLIFFFYRIILYNIYDFMCSIDFRWEIVKAKKMYAVIFQLSFLDLDFVNIV